MATNVQFTDTSTGTITSWLWEFGDGATSALQNPLHNYALDGTYTVTLHVFGAYGGYDQISQTISVPDAFFTVNITAPGQTLTITSLGVSADCVVDWGDLAQETVNGTAQRTHVYAGIGVYTVRLLNPSLVTTFEIADNKVTLNSADVASLINISVFAASGLAAGNFDSADVVAWTPASFRLFSMPAGYTGAFNSADVAAWTPAVFRMTAMPAGYAGLFDSADIAAWNTGVFLLTTSPGLTGTFDSADVAAWNPSNFQLASMPAGYAGIFDSADVAAWNPTTFILFTMPVSFTIIISAGGFAAWSATGDFRMQNNALLQAAIDQILTDLYAALAIRTASNGTINLGGSNAAPSGILQAACPPTTGKETAFELANDSCAINPGHDWATVTITP